MPDMPLPQLHIRKVLDMKDLYNRSIDYLRLSVTEQCNLRCRYCMPEEGSGPCRKEMMTKEEMVMAVRAAAELGITKVRITGGEPLIHPEIIPICRSISQIPGITETVMTTNGTRLAQYADALLEAGIQRINVSLDTLDPKKYRLMTRGGQLENVLQGIERALRTGFRKIKINTVLIGGYNTDEIGFLAELTVKYPLDVRFIELMPTAGNTGLGQDCYVSAAAVLDALPEAVYEQEEGVAKMYRLPGAAGRIGLITPVSQHFCASCSRIRLTADGKLKPCLLSSEEISIKGLNEEGMREQIYRAIMEKPKRHGPLSAVQRSESERSMNRVGG